MDKHRVRGQILLINSALWNCEQIMWLPAEFLRAILRLTFVGKGCDEFIGIV